MNRLRVPGDRIKSLYNPLHKTKSNLNSLKVMVSRYLLGKRYLTRTPKEWLHSYKPRELFDQDGRPPSGIDKVLLPREEKRMGRRKETYDAYRPLDLPDWKQFGQQKGKDVSETMVVGQYLAEVFKGYL